MAFYDSVKDDVRREEGEEPDGEQEDDTMPFDQLKKDAEGEEDGDESSSSDTEIEVLGDGNPEPAQSQQGPQASQQSPAQQPSEPSASDGANKAKDTVEQATAEPSSRDAEPDGETATEILRRIEQQNDEMLNVLRGIKRSLE